MKFSGFQEGKKNLTGIPDQFFSELLPEIRDFNELKLVFYILWSAYTQGDYGVAIRPRDILLDQIFINGLNIPESDKSQVLNNLFEKIVDDNIIIKVEASGETSFFINSPRGRAAAELMRSGSLIPSEDIPKTTLDAIKPNIFRLYEDNIGPLTPLIAESLHDAQESYPEDWIEEAIRIAVANNVRRWKYISRILDRWQEEGRDGTDRRNAQEDYRRYLKGEYGEFGSH